MTDEQPSSRQTTPRRRSSAGPKGAAAPKPSVSPAPGVKVVGNVASSAQRRYMVEARRRMARAKKEIVALEERAIAGPRGQFAGLLREIHATRRMMEAQLRRLVPGMPDWDAAADAFEGAERSLGTLLRTVRSSMDADPQTGGACAPPALRRQVAAWESQLDELIVQAHLAGMDARDELARLRDELQEVRHTVRRAAIDEPSDHVLRKARSSFRTLSRNWERLQRQAAQR